MALMNLGNLRIPQQMEMPQWLVATRIRSVCRPLGRGIQCSPSGSLSRVHSSRLAGKQSSLTAQFTPGDPLPREPSSVWQFAGLVPVACGAQVAVTGGQDPRAQADSSR